MSYILLVVYSADDADDADDDVYHTLFFFPIILWYTVFDCGAEEKGTLFCVICVILWLKSCETAFLACSFVTQKKVPASFLRHPASSCVILRH